MKIPNASALWFSLSLSAETKWRALRTRKIKLKYPVPSTNFTHPHEEVSDEYHRRVKEGVPFDEAFLA